MRERTRAAQAQRVRPDMSHPIRSTLATWSTRLGFALSSARRYQGVDVRIFLPGPEREISFEKVHFTLALISQYSPPRFRQLGRDLRGIWITETAGNLAEYHHPEGLCLLDRAYVSQPDITASHVAATIIHEATHARLRRAGFGYEPELRRRIENVCFRAEVRFAAYLPDGQEIVDEARAQLERDPIVWTAAAADERATSKLRELGVPEWMIRFILFIFRRQQANKPAAAYRHWRRNRSTTAEGMESDLQQCSLPELSA